MDLTTLYTSGFGGFVLGASLAWILLKIVAPKTETKWDDKIVDIIEGIALEAGIDIDEVVKKSTGKLKQEIIKQI